MTAIDLDNVTIHVGDCLDVLRELPEKSVQCCVTSPPYWGLRDYGVDGQLGLEPTPEEYVANMVEVFREVRRVLRDDGTLWMNIGDSYATSPAGNFGKDMPAPADGGRYRENKPKMDWARGGLKQKDLCGIPWRVAFALQADGWYLRQDIIWHKPNPMPESVTDRCTKSHEYVFLLSKSARYFYDADAIKEPVTQSTAERLTQPTLDRQNGSNRVPGKTNGNMKAVGNIDTRNKRSVWTVTTAPYSKAHFATFPPKLIEPCILAGCPEGGVVLDPFLGSGTTAAVAQNLGRKCIGIELNEEYAQLARDRFSQRVLF
jgi:DNA modification methylase